MDLANLASCGGTTGKLNTGVPLCDIIRDIPDGLMLLDAGVSFDTKNKTLVQLIADMKAATQAARGSRLYPIWNLTNFEDKTKEPVKGATGNLTNSEIQLVDAIPSFSFQHRSGEFFHKLLYEAEKGGYTLLIVDKKKVIYGTTDFSGNLTGFSMSEFITQLPKFQTPSAVSYYGFDVTLGNLTEYKENLMLVQADSSLKSILGLRNIYLSPVTPVVGSILNLDLKGDGGKNITELFSAQLAQPGAYIVKDSLGVSVTVSPAFDSGNKRMALTLSGAAWTGALSNAVFTVDLVSAISLAGLAQPISGFESTGPQTFIKP